MKTLSKIFMLVIFSALLSSCEKYVIEPVQDVKFAANIESIFVGKCSGCHSSSGGLDFSQGNVYNTLTTYDGGALLDLATPSDSKILDLATNGHGNNVSAGQADMILKWIEDGALND